MRGLPLIAAAALAAALAAGPAHSAQAAPALAAAPDIAVASVQARLAQLQSIATANGGNRATAGGLPRAA